jgi:hypothetical protein
MSIDAVILTILLSAPVQCPHVRANGDAAIAWLIDEASRASATFRSLVTAINNTNGLVYVEQGRCRHGVRACLMLSVTVAGPHRILRIVLDLNRDPVGLLAVLGHELQHALEVLSNARLTTSQDVYLFYLRAAPTANDTFETDAAIRAGLQVERDVLASRTTRGQP